MAVYRRQRAKHKFEARGPGELSLQKGDIIRVWKDETGEWPDMENWVTGENEKTKLKGEFPGNYTVFVEEVDPDDIPPPLPTRADQNGPSPPPVPARHASEPPSLHPPHSRQPPPISPRLQSESRGFPQPEPKGYHHAESRGYPQPEQRVTPQPEPRGHPQPEPRSHPQEPWGYPQPNTQAGGQGHDLVEQDCNRPVKCAACK